MRVMTLGATLLLLMFVVVKPCLANNAILSWEPSDETSVAGYKVHYGSAPGNYVLVRDVGLGSLDPSPCTITFTGCQRRKYTIFGLAPGTYYFAVSAYNTNGESGYSDEVSKTTTADTTLPQDVINFTSTRLNATTVRLSWTNPSDSDLASLDLEYNYNGGTMISLTTLKPALPSNAHTFDHKNLAPGTYNYAIHTRDTSGNRTNTALTSAFMPAPPVLSPANIRFAATAYDTGMQLSWTTPSFPAGIAQIGLEYSSDEMNFVRLADYYGTAPGKTHTYRHLNLNDGVHLYHMTMYDADGTKLAEIFIQIFLTACNCGEEYALVVKRTSAQNDAPPMTLNDSGSGGGGCGATKGPHDRGGPRDISMLLLLGLAPLLFSKRKNQTAQAYA